MKFLLRIKTALYVIFTQKTAITIIINGDLKADISEEQLREKISGVISESFDFQEVPQ